MSRKRKKEPRKLDRMEWVIIGIGTALLLLGIFSICMMLYKAHELKTGSEIQSVKGQITYVEKERKGLTSQQQKEKDRLEEMGLPFTDYDYRYRVDVTYEAGGAARKGQYYSETPVAEGDEVKLQVFRTGFGKYRILDEDSYGVTAFLSYLIYGVLGTVIGLGLILLCVLNLMMDNAPIRKKEKEKERRQKEHQRRQEEARRRKEEENR